MGKRRRTETPEDEQSGSQNALTNHPELWFEDGNVVLAVGDTAFRVYRGILASASPVFKDLFTIPQPSDGEMMDGCPVVQLEDAEEDMENFLKVLFKGVHSIGVDDPHDMWRVTRAMLRLGDKYQMEDLVAEGKKRLKARFPKDIPSLDALRDGRAYVMGNTEDIIAMANTTRLLKLSGVHLRALYLCCQLSADVLLDGCPGADGTREYLCKEDLAGCFNARQALTEAYATLCLDFFNEFDTPMSDSSAHKTLRCHAGVYDIYYQLRESVFGMLGHDPLAPPTWIKDECSDMCQGCGEAYNLKGITMRQDLLDRLKNFIKVEL